MIQKTVRMGLARRKYKPRYEMLMKINQLSTQLQKLGSMGKNLKTEKVKEMCTESRESFLTFLSFLGLQ